MAFPLSFGHHNRAHRPKGLAGETPLNIARYPRCRFNGCRLVVAFPAGCPFAEPNPVAAIDAIRKFDPFNKRANTCGECVTELMANSTVQDLRAARPSATTQAAAVTTGGAILCPVCGGPTKRRTSKIGPFMGCAKYPKCKGVVHLEGTANER